MENCDSNLLQISEQYRQCNIKYNYCSYDYNTLEYNENHNDAKSDGDCRGREPVDSKFAGTNRDISERNTQLNFNVLYGYGCEYGENNC